MQNQNQNSRPAAQQEPPITKTVEDVMTDFVELLDRLIERGENARRQIRAQLDRSAFYSYLFASEALSLARSEVVERECRTFRTYLQDASIEDSLLEKLNNISRQIDRKRANYRVSLERSTNAIANEIANAETEAMYEFYFSPNRVSDSHLIQEYCREAVQSM